MSTAFYRSFYGAILNIYFWKIQQGNLNSYYGLLGDVVIVRFLQHAFKLIKTLFAVTLNALVPGGFQ